MALNPGALLFSGPKIKGFIPPEDRVSGLIALELDVLMAETPEYTANLSRSGLESGGTVSDHMELVPLKLNIEAIISATPASFAKLLRVGILGDPVGDGHRMMKKLQQDREPFDFVGGFETYFSMVLTAYTPTRTKDTGRALHFTATLEQLKFATTDVVPVFSKIKPKAIKGVQLTDPASNAANGKWIDVHSHFQGVEPTAGTIGTLVTAKGSTLLNSAPIPIGGL